MGRRQDVHRVLGGIVERFPEGDATVELREARAVLAGEAA